MNKKAILSGFGLISLCGFGNAASYASNFDSYTYGADVNGLDGWSLSGASGSDVAVISVSPFPAPVSGGQGLSFGYGEIDAASAYLYRSGGGAGLVGNPMGYTQFQAAFTVQDSVPSFVNRDQFAFTFRGASNENLLTIQLAPTAQSGSPQLNPLRTDQYSWSSDFAAGNLNIGSLNEGQWSTLNVLFTPSGVNDVAFTIKFQGTTAASGTLVGAATQGIGSYGFVWTPLDSANEGSNVLLVDDVSLVPEPSSALLASLAGLGLCLRRRRA